MNRPIQAAAEDFGARMASFRKAAGYTQQRLADRVGATRRVIAYYEAESERPPAALLVKLAVALGCSTDALLGLIPAKNTVRRPTISTRWERRVRQIERLAPGSKQKVLAIIDAVLTAEQSKRSASA